MTELQRPHLAQTSQHLQFSSWPCEAAEERKGDKISLVRLMKDRVKCESNAVLALELEAILDCCRK